VVREFVQLRGLGLQQALEDPRLGYLGRHYGAR
jgi:hypothetical protein